MGWAHCGDDSKGRPIGYAVAAICDHPGCDCQIDRGLSYACAGMHGQQEVGCEGYFCSEHLSNLVVEREGYVRVCDQCIAEMRASGEWVDDDDEGTLIRAGL